ncbi:MAG: SIS domain-containing protein [Anaerococcus sp.]|nr:SIS domain-containing protein [Anaerococcus sp.]
MIVQINGGLKMRKFYKKRFCLTDKGAKDLTKSTISSFLVYCINMVPAFILMMLTDQLLLKNVKSPYLYFGVSVVTLVIMYVLLAKEYDDLYTTTYEESANLRIDIAETLSKLPLSYFSKHNLSDISQTIMADVEKVEHAMSHSIPKVGGMVLFFPLIGIMLMIGNFKMGLAVMIPTILSFILIPIAKKSQVKGNEKYHKVLRENSEKFQETIELQQEINSFNLSDEVKTSLYKQMDESEKIKTYAKEVKDFDSMFYIGRGLDYKSVIEGSLKLKEVSYIHSEALAAGELKHGTIALIENGTPVVVVASQENIMEKTISNVKEIISRGANIFSISKKDDHLKEISNFNFELPQTIDPLYPVLSVIPQQILAYYVSCAKGLDVDKPRNLAKSVTVE